MVYVNSQKFACAPCIKGHRSSSCCHSERPLFEVKKKGRPVSQCEKCRDLRKSKRMHIKCCCSPEEADTSNDSGSRSPVQSLVNRPYKRKLPSHPTLPNGLKDLWQAPRQMVQHPKQSVASLLNPCECKSVLRCDCDSQRVGASDKAAQAPYRVCHSNDIPSHIIDKVPNDSDGPIILPPLRLTSEEPRATGNVVLPPIEFIVGQGYDKHIANVHIGGLGPYTKSASGVSSSSENLAPPLPRRRKRANKSSSAPDSNSSVYDDSESAQDTTKSSANHERGFGLGLGLLASANCCAGHCKCRGGQCTCTQGCDGRCRGDSRKTKRETKQRQADKGAGSIKSNSEGISSCCRRA
ncbi:hypothetical protein M422DRAFT_29892 [Sphaerobolus stellatus SS14]|uniref:Copper-fist domain-containing protein n=1 Tax=Sphaerobolus stellatus (strain SS14) TaxID=990650 RepID=A0A0C9UQ49_SPHS4|nr:hypothetical protein M422DRAFT_29892 [Sphaerobolus stellatus SS14]